MCLPDFQYNFWLHLVLFLPIIHRNGHHKMARKCASLSMKTLFLTLFKMAGPTLCFWAENSLPLIPINLLTQELSNISKLSQLYLQLSLGNRILNAESCFPSQMTISTVPFLITNAQLTGKCADFSILWTAFGCL